MGAETPSENRSVVFSDYRRMLLVVAGVLSASFSEPASAFQGLRACAAMRTAQQVSFPLREDVDGGHLEREYYAITDTLQYLAEEPHFTELRREVEIGDLVQRIEALYTMPTHLHPSSLSEPTITYESVRVTLIDDLLAVDELSEENIRKIEKLLQGSAASEDRDKIESIIAWRSEETVGENHAEDSSSMQALQSIVANTTILTSQQKPSEVLLSIREQLLIVLRQLRDSRRFSTEDTTVSVMRTYRKSLDIDTILQIGRIELEDPLDSRHSSSNTVDFMVKKGTNRVVLYLFPSPIGEYRAHIEAMFPRHSVDQSGVGVLEIAADPETFSIEDVIRELQDPRRERINAFEERNEE